MHTYRSLIESRQRPQERSPDSWHGRNRFPRRVYVWDFGTWRRDIRANDVPAVEVLCDSWSVNWTDDMTVHMARGTSTRGLVSYLRKAGEDHTPRREILAVLTERFALSFDDARLVMDRVGGGITRAKSGNRQNEPDPIKDPVAWTSYRIELGLSVYDEVLEPLREETESAEVLLARARRGEPTTGTKDVGVALEVARLAVESQEPDATRYHLLLEAATSLSVAAESCIARLGNRPCAPEGSQEWVDGAALAGAARQVTDKFAAQPDPQLEEHGLGLVGRITTMLLGQCHAFVGRAMLDSIRCIHRNGDANRAVSDAEAVLADFQVLLDQFASDAPFDEHVIALEYLLAAIELIISVRGSSFELSALQSRTKQVLARSSTD